MEAGQLIERQSLDMVLGNDITTPVAVNEFEKGGPFDKVFDKDQDRSLCWTTLCTEQGHQGGRAVPRPDRSLCRHTLTSAISYDVGKMGIEHALLPEQGMVAAGDCIIGADSHTCTYGARRRFFHRCGLARIWRPAWSPARPGLRCLPPFRLKLTGKLLPNWVSGKDVILHHHRDASAWTARSTRSLEFTGDGVQGSFHGRPPVHLPIWPWKPGAKNGIFPVDEVTLEYLKRQVPARAGRV